MWKDESEAGLEMGCLAVNAFRRQIKGIAGLQGWLASGICMKLHFDMIALFTLGKATPYMMLGWADGWAGIIRRPSLIGFGLAMFMVASQIVSSGRFTGF